MKKILIILLASLLLIGFLVLRVPAQTPQLYVSLHTESLPAQSFRALQLSHDWESWGEMYSATSVHPLDVWATGFLHHLGWEEDAITFHLADTEGEIRLRFNGLMVPIRACCSKPQSHSCRQ